MPRSLVEVVRSGESVETMLFQMMLTNDIGQKLRNGIRSLLQVHFSSTTTSLLIVAPEPEHNPAYDADFFADNDTGGFGDGGFGDDVFADAREQFSPGAPRVPGADTSQSGEFGSILRARRARPDYVNYAKTAKKVDVKRLKENLWAKLDLPEVLPVQQKISLTPLADRSWRQNRRPCQRSLPRSFGN